MRPGTNNEQKQRSKPQDDRDRQGRRCGIIEDRPVLVKEYKKENVESASTVRFKNTDKQTKSQEVETPSSKASSPKRKKTKKKSKKKWLTPRVTPEQNKPLFVEPGAGKHLGIPQDWGFKDFVLKEPVGHGAFGTVFRAREVVTGITLALKVMRLEVTKTPGDTCALREELKTHSQLRHKNICRMYGYFLTADYLVFVMEYCGGGSLLSEMHKQKYHVFTCAQAAYYIKQIAQAVETCHQHRIMHRDLKPENILLDNNNQVKLSDFGWACKLDEGERRLTHGGTTEFNAPEVVIGEIGYDYEAEVWSLGCILYEMVYGESPFRVEGRASHFEKSESERKLMIEEERINKIIHFTPKYKAPPGTTVDVQLRNLIKACLHKDEKKRIKLKDFLVHPGIAQYTQQNGKQDSNNKD